MSLEPTEGEESKNAAQVKRKTPSSDLRDQVAKFARQMDSALDEILELFEEYAIPDDWIAFDPCDEEGVMYWKWKRINGQYCLWVFADSNLATVENMETTEVMELVSLSKAVRRLKRMMQEDEEE